MKNHVKWKPLGALLAVSVLSSAAMAQVPTPICSVLGGGSSTITSTVTPAVTADAVGASFDGDLGTFATFKVLGVGNISIRGTAQTGTVSPGSGLAGVVVTSPGTNDTINVTITTYLNGVQQQSGAAGLQTIGVSQICAGTCLSRGDQTFFGIPTSAPFDSIAATMTALSVSGVVEVRELCARP